MASEEGQSNELKIRHILQQQEDVLTCTTEGWTLKNIQLNARSQTHQANIHHLYECPGETKCVDRGQTSIWWPRAGARDGNDANSKGFCFKWGWICSKIKLWSWLYKTVNRLTRVELHFLFLKKRWLFRCCLKPAYGSSILPTSASQVVGTKHIAPHLAEPHAPEWPNYVVYESHLKKAFFFFFSSSHCQESNRGQ